MNVKVSDTGIGMSRTVLERAMDPFFTTKPTGKGTGLGLPIVYGTVKAHRGKLKMESEPGRGTSVLLQFPVSSNRMPDPRSQPQNVVPHDRQQFSILIVDDDEIIQDSASEIVKTLGHKPIVASGGSRAIAVLESGLQPDLIVLDMNMPGMGGVETLERIRHLFGRLPVLLSTGRVDQAALDVVASDTDVSLLPKPYTLEEFQQKMESRLLGA